MNSVFGHMDPGQVNGMGELSASCQGIDTNPDNVPDIIKRRPPGATSTTSSAPTTVIWSAAERNEVPGALCSKVDFGLLVLTV